MQERLLFGIVPVYGLLIAAGIFAALLLCTKQEKEKGLPADTSIDLALWVVPLAVIGARLYYVIFQWPQYRQNLLSVFRGQHHDQIVGIGKLANKVFFKKPFGELCARIAIRFGGDGQL